MKTLIILAHENFKNSRINKVLINSIEGNADITIHNLYELYDNFNIDAQKEIELLKSHEKIIFQFPLQWYSCPSLLKKWEDVVFSTILHSDNRKILANKIFQVITTTGGAEHLYNLAGSSIKMMTDILFPFNLTAEYMSMKTLPVFCVFDDQTLAKDSMALDKIVQDYKKNIS